MSVCEGEAGTTLATDARDNDSEPDPCELPDPYTSILRKDICLCNLTHFYIDCDYGEIKMRRRRSRRISCLSSS